MSAVMGVGRDCGCGYPLVWIRDHQACSVWGTHPSRGERVQFSDQRYRPPEVVRNRNAAGARLVDLVAEHDRKQLAERRKTLRIVREEVTT